MLCSGFAFVNLYLPCKLKVVKVFVSRHNFEQMRVNSTNVHFYIYIQQSLIKMNSEKGHVIIRRSPNYFNSAS